MNWFKKFYNYIVVLASLIIFICLRLILGSNIFLYILTILLGVGLHFGISYFFDAKQKAYEASAEYLSKQRAKENEENLSYVIDKLREMINENTTFEDVIYDFIHRVNEFSQKKETALNALIEMNNDDSKKFLQERSQATMSFIIANAKKLSKALIVYNAQSKKNRPSNVKDVVAVQEVFQSMDTLMSDFDKLLEEVSMRDYDFNPEDPGLKDAVENLQETRTASQIEEEDEEEEEIPSINLHVNGSNG